MSKIKELQLSSDIRGIAIGTEEFDATLTVEESRLIASAFVKWLQKRYPSKKVMELVVGIGRDSRISGPDLTREFIQVLSAFDVRVIDFEMATTPSMFMATQFEEFNCDATVMFTASHLPFYYNGLKFFTREGGLESSDIRDIIALVDEKEEVLQVPVSTIEVKSIFERYSNHLVELIRKGSGSEKEKPLEGLHIIVDAGNGAGGFYAEKVLEVLGANTKGSQFLDPDGTFPNHIPNPDNKEAMESIKNQVLAVGADYGVIFDTDVDRAAVVTGDGELLNRNNLIAVFSVIAISEHPGTTIVTNSPTTEHLKRFITELGGHQYRYISGYRNVINKAIELNKAGTDCQLAIETSGHAAFKENYFLDDGAYVVAKILMLLPRLLERGETLDYLIKDDGAYVVAKILMLLPRLLERGETLDYLIKQLVQPKEVVEVRFKIETEDFKTYGNEVIKEFPQWIPQDWVVNPENEEGVRIDFKGEYGDGWLLLRMSLHEPLLVLQIENDLVGYQKKILETIQKIMNRYPKINQNKLEALLK